MIRLSGFFQLDDGLYSQSAASRVRYGDIQDGVGFRRARLQALGELTEFMAYTIEVDFAQAGRPSLLDVWGEIDEIPWLGTIRIGQFRQPGLMDSWTSVRHLDFLERSAAFQAVDPFRRVGIMAYAMSEDERTSWAYSVYATGLTFWNGVSTTYKTFGDNRYGTQLGDNGGVSFSSRITHLLHYDELSGGRYLLHVGGGYLYSQVGGEGDTLPFGKAYNSQAFPEFFLGDPGGGGLTAAGTPLVIDAGQILANDFSLYHLELAGNRGPFHFQSETDARGDQPAERPDDAPAGGLRPVRPVPDRRDAGLSQAGRRLRLQRRAPHAVLRHRPPGPAAGLGGLGAGLPLDLRRHVAGQRRVRPTSCSTLKTQPPFPNYGVLNAVDRGGELVVEPQHAAAVQLDPQHARSARLRPGSLRHLRHPFPGRVLRSTP